MITSTHTAVESVKKNPKQNAEQKKRRYFEALDRKAQAYIAVMEYSGLSLGATALLQYLMCKQGRNSHAFPSIREMKTRFRCNHRKIKSALSELAIALPEVFQIVKEGGKSRDSYYLTPYKEWPLDVCERLWFCVPTLGTVCDPTVGTRTPLSDPTVGTLYGNNMCDGTYGDSKVVEEAIVCSICTSPATQKYRGRPVCSFGTECHQELGAMYG